jgi:hypothetical protein
MKLQDEMKRELSGWPTYTLLPVSRIIDIAQKDISLDTELTGLWPVLREM